MNNLISLSRLWLFLPMALDWSCSNTKQPADGALSTVKQEILQSLCMNGGKHQAETVLRILLPASIDRWSLSVHIYDNVYVSAFCLAGNVFSVRKETAI